MNGALQVSANDLERAAQTALSALQALGYKDMRLDLAVRGLCLECAPIKAEGSEALAKGNK
tara:strand:- start:398 stop:580 length:183 start_codon:yes stop_codon:yes gene_type:complete